MNFFLTLLVVMIGLSIVYQVLGGLLRWLKSGLPVCCRFTFTKVRNLARYLLRPTTTTVKELPRTHVNPLRRYLSEYVTLLEKGNGGPTLREWWIFYESKVPEQYRLRGSNTPHPLPYWMEQVASFLNNDSAQKTLKFILLYFFLVLTSHLWLPYVTEVNIHPLQSASVELGVDPCVWAAATTDPLCFLFTNDLLSRQTLTSITSRDVLFRTHHHHHHDNRSNLTDTVVVDEEDTVYYPLEFVVPQKENSPETVLISRYVTDEQLLTLLRKESVDTCICPLFLNIVSNVSFLYDESEKRWMVMREATLYRNNSFAELVASTITYNERSRFFTKHKQWQSLVGEFVHYDSFVVEYTEDVPPPEAVNVNVAEANYRLRENAYTKASIFKRGGVDRQRKQIHVSGSEAICFVYCDTLAHKRNK